MPLEAKSANSVERESNKYSSSVHAATTRKLSTVEPNLALCPFIFLADYPCTIAEDRRQEWLIYKALLPLLIHALEFSMYCSDKFNQ